MLVQTIYIEITPKTQLKRYVNCLYVYNISFPTVIFYSWILPKYGEKSLGDINYINESAFNLCARNHKMDFICHNSFAVDWKSFFWKDTIHTNKQVLEQLAFDLIKDVRYCRFLNQWFFFPNIFRYIFLVAFGVFLYIVIETICNRF